MVMKMSVFTQCDVSFPKESVAMDKQPMPPACGANVDHGLGQLQPDTSMVTRSTRSHYCSRARPTAGACPMLQCSPPPQFFPTSTARILSALPWGFGGSESWREPRRTYLERRLGLGIWMAVHRQLQKKSFPYWWRTSCNIYVKMRQLSGEAVCTCWTTQGQYGLCCWDYATHKRNTC